MISPADLLSGSATEQAVAGAERLIDASLIKDGYLPFEGSIGCCFRVAWGLELCREIAKRYTAAGWSVDLDDDNGTHRTLMITASVGGTADVPT